MRTCHDFVFRDPFMNTLLQRWFISFANGKVDSRRKLSYCLPFLSCLVFPLRILWHSLPWQAVVMRHRPQAFFQQMFIAGRICLCQSQSDDSSASQIFPLVLLKRPGCVTFRSQCCFAHEFWCVRVLGATAVIFSTGRKKMLNLTATAILCLFLMPAPAVQALWSQSEVLATSTKKQATESEMYSLWGSSTAFWRVPLQKGRTVVWLWSLNEQHFIAASAEQISRAWPLRLYFPLIDSVYYFTLCSRKWPHYHLGCCLLFLCVGHQKYEFPD